MRLPRLKVPASERPAYYHCISRVVDRQFHLDPSARNLFLKYLREYERFCGVRVLTFCILSNHFHLLVEVPQRPSLPLSESEILDRLSLLSGCPQAASIRQRFDALRSSPAAYDALRHSLLARMWDISAFMKLLKQRFTQSFNRHHHRSGTLWEARFKSVLVDGPGQALATMAAYIDLNPVRAGLVDDPKDYPWCGYACALASQHANPFQTILQGLGVASDLPPLDAYRQWLFLQGAQDGSPSPSPSASPSAPPSPHSPIAASAQPHPPSPRPGFDPDTVRDVLRSNGRLPLHHYLRIRIRYFSDGAALGSRDFVEAVFSRFRRCFGKNRRSGARRLRGLQSPLFCLRSLQREVFGPRAQPQATVPPPVASHRGSSGGP